MARFNNQIVRKGVRVRDLSKNSNKYKKYAFRKIGKFFGSCVIATMISLGVAVTLPSNNAYASVNGSDGEPEKITDLSTSSQGYEVRVPKGKKYVRNNEVENHTPRLIHEGKDGRSFIKEKEVEESEEMKSLFETLYDEDNDGVIDAKYKRADANTINEHAGNAIAGTEFVEPKVSEVDTKYPHRVDAGVTNINDIYDSNNDGKPDKADGVIDENDTIVEANKPITVDPNAEENVVKEDGTVVLSKYYRIHVNEGDTADKDDDIYEVGTKPKVERTPIPFETTYERDDSIPKGEERETTAGVNGETVKTTTYEVNPTTGEVTANEPTSETTNPVTRVVKRGTQPKVERTPIPFETRFERDDSIPKGEERETTVGVNGETVKTTTYELNSTTGEVTAKEPISETTNPVTRVVKRGTQPKVEKTPIPFETRYERDDSIPEGTEEEVTAGVNGEIVKTTTYELNPTTGEVTTNEPTSETTNPVTRVVKRGTQPKVEKTPIPFETRYERDDSIPEGTEEEVTAGVNGEIVKTTTYELNPTTGEVTTNEPKTATTDPVTRVVKRGTQPKSGETPETPQPEKPGEIPENPQPEKGSETEESSTLKVAPPTIAIVEEVNKASFEVKAPKKDADTVKITYPKSNGSGDEVLTLTKQPSGEWTLDKQPENVTLDKTTGTVTIPRESVVNKQKVQAQSKHKTSDYTPFVYAALSIEEANPEHPVTLWVDTAGKEIKEKVVGKKVQAGEIAGYKWLSSRLEEGILTHKFEKVTNGTSSIPNQPESVTNNTNKPSNSTPEKSSEIKKSLIRTVWKTQDGKQLKSPSTDKQEAGEFEGYEFVESHLEGDNVTVHVFRAKKTATNTPNEKTTQPEEKQVAVATVTSDKNEEETLSSPTSERVELPNTGTATNVFFTSEVAAILAGLGILIPGVKKKETEE